MLETSSNILYLENYISQTNDNTIRAALLDAINMSKKEMVRKVHKYSIRQMSGKDNRWLTYIPADNAKKRKEIKRPTENDIYNYLYKFYGFDGISFAELFKKWLPVKEAMTSSMSTIRRHEQHFNKYFVSRNSMLLKRNIKNISKLELQLECNRLIKECELTKKEWINVATILRGMFQYAMNENWISVNPFEGIQISVHFRQVKRKLVKEEIFDKQEYPLLKSYMNQKYSEEPDDVYLAILFQAYTGMRVGEITAAKWEDIDTERRQIHIVREDISEDYRISEGKYAKHRVIADHTKGYQDRFVDLLPPALDILKRLSHQTEWLFSRNGERLTERQINYQLEKFSEKSDIITKRSHKLRKTYASNLHEAGIALKKIQNDLGHQSIRTTEAYIIEEPDERDYQLKAMAV